ncbi:MAG: CoA-binding protein [Candidatus Mcinerneyibacterium aminivorans]|jgi:hypothetical protein|uniref:CoA-binding protein n=1 Tax=Candidatus Mcinerneyibacterium aminivorans TaxID=2703815 RepID=A0A5D0MB86_9BACT|nr:MAG: CoA-binding protein [Candidatus Mcinerneyibacterium aminivorans]
MENLIQIFKKQKNIAVVGATDKEEKYGFKVFKKLKKIGYTVFPVNPNVDFIENDEVYNSISKVNDRIDAVSMIVNPQVGKNIIKEINRKNIDLVWFQPGAYNEELIDYCRENNIKVIYERCVLADL